jgi:subtilisin family serine protease
VIKTKNPEAIKKDNLSFESQELNDALKNIHIIKFRRPFDYFNTEKFRNKDKFGLGRIIEIYFSDEIDPIVLVNQLKKCILLEYSCPYMKHEPCFVPNDSMYNDQYYLQKIDAEHAWDITTGDSSIVIAIVDTEVDWEHEDLAENIWLNQGECGLDSLGRDKRTNGIDDDGNGKIDDWYGWDFCSDMTLKDLEKGIMKEDNDTKIRDSASHSNHGTFVASDAAAVTNNGIGMASIGYHTKILPVKVRSDNNEVWRGFDGILYAALQGASIINCSWGTIGISPEENDIINEITALGSLLIVSSGNSSLQIDDNDNFYSNYKNILLVGASNENDNPAAFTCYGTLVTSYAPGTNVLSAVPYNKYMKFSGTSMSAPITAGVAALVRSLHPDWTPQQIRHQIRSSSDNVLVADSLRYLYYGRINARKALEYNKTFDAGTRLPGLEVDSISVNTPSGEIDTYNPVQVSFFIKNYLSSVKNLVLSIISFDSLLNPADSIKIDSIGTLSVKKIDINFAITSRAKWYDKITRFLVKFKSKDYTDYQYLRLPIKPPAEKIINENTNLYRNNNLKQIGMEFPVFCSAANLNTLWIIGYDSTNHPCYCIATITGIRKFGYFGSEKFINSYYINGLSEFQAIACLTDSNARSYLIKTEDGGSSWFNINLPSNIYQIFNISFKNQTDGFFIASKVDGSPNYIILNTSDAGKSWNLPNTIPQIDDYPNPESVHYYNNTRWFSTAKGCIFLSGDNGLNWEKKCSSDSSNFYLLQFRDNCRAISISDSFGNEPIIKLKETTDCGESWTIPDSSNILNFIYPPDILYTTNDFSKIIIADDYGRMALSENLGKSWIPVLINSKYGISSVIKYFKYAPIRDGKKNRIWMVADSISYIDFDDILDMPDLTNLDEALIYKNIYPNPSEGDGVRYQVWLSKKENITVKLINYIGKDVKMIFQGDIVPDQYSTIYFDTAGLSSGLYFIKTVIGNKIYIDKLIIIN